MAITNPTQILTEAVRLPQAIENALPAKAPKLSATLIMITGKLPALPNFPLALPDLPAAPTLPTGASGLGAKAGAGADARVKTRVTGVIPLVFN